MLADRSELSSLGICPTAWGSKIFLAGSVGNWFAWDFGGEYSNTINIYDVVQKKWTSSSLSEQKGLMGGLTVNGKTYFAGGINDAFGQQTNLPIKTVEIYDLQTGAVSFSCLANEVIQPDIVHHGSNIIFFTSKSTQGGWVPRGVETDVFNIYHLNTGEWKVGKLPVNIHDAHMLKVGNRIFIVGGVVNGQPSTEIWELDF
jgi:hypothetical protein